LERSDESSRDGDQRDSYLPKPPPPLKAAQPTPRTQPERRVAQTATRTAPTVESRPKPVVRPKPKPKPKPKPNLDLGAKSYPKAEPKHEAQEPPSVPSAVSFYEELPDGRRVAIKPGDPRLPMLRQQWRDKQQEQRRRRR
jgi:hypothetical protein